MENITALYEYHYDGEMDGIVIDKYKDEQEVVTIPESIDGLPVTAIGLQAFYMNNYLITVTLPGSIISIGHSAFSGCIYLNEINIPRGVTSIGSNAFNGCLCLSKITIPDSVTEIGGGAFSNCSDLTEITIPDSVTFIGESAFYACSNLNKIDLPDSITFIGKSAFMDCRRLTSIHLPGRLTSINEGTFYNCYNLTEITIPDSVTIIGSDAFSQCGSLKSITIPENITSIDRSAFNECYKLKDMTIPDNVAFISEGAFEQCPKLTITYKGRRFDSSDLEEFYPLFWDHPSIKKYHYEEHLKGIVIDKYGDRESSVSIPKHIDGCPVVHIGYEAFCKDNYDWPCGNETLTDLVIPDSVTSIGDMAFYGSSNLVNVTIPDSVTYIGDYAFKICRCLTHIALPDSVTYIGKDSFEDCGDITITYKGREYNNENLEDLYALSDVSRIRCFNHDFILQSDSLYIPVSEFVIDNPDKVFRHSFEGCNKILICSHVNGIYTVKYLFAGKNALNAYHKNYRVKNNIESPATFISDGCEPGVVYI